MASLEDDVDFVSLGFTVALEFARGSVATASAVIDWDSVKHVVLAELEEHEALRPTRLLTRLGDKFPDVVIKDSVQRLLQEQSIKMPPDQQLELPEDAA